ncbi:GNAT family N-acetyltransferase [Paenibacillus harenae]|uniref:Ribosomal protein S18 acetylase RimI-like enzyme n=1 Tax=Paenibacillus harenae TaxID=306543 RepID=A0ABT9UC37_PAEHA|nr:GNAT family N-acetyltransferase [Paenibacillus harenae]MDQ0116275.1 ribosomal protein S18 acetylase RimI-like enzyme [Paenibacillus harenae]
MILIRGYRPEDMEAMAALMLDLGYPTNAEQMKARLERLGEVNENETLVATIEDKVVGMIGFRKMYYYEADGFVVHINVLVTKNEYQGQGVGKQLIAYTEQRAKEQGANSLYLTSGMKPERERAHAFYRNLGFQTTGYRFVKPL